MKVLKLTLNLFRNYPKKFFATTKNIKVDCNACFNKDPTIGNICVLCKTINSPLKYVQHLDYFEIFNIEADFFIDKNKLDSQYKLIQKLIHPDKFSTKSEVFYYLINNRLNSRMLKKLLR